MKLTAENRSTRGKTCRNATLSTTNPTWNDPGSNSGLRVTNRLNHGTAKVLPWKSREHIYSKSCYLLRYTASYSEHCEHDLQYFFAVYIDILKTKGCSRQFTLSLYLLDYKQQTVPLKLSDMWTAQIKRTAASVFLYFSLPMYAISNNVVCKTQRTVCFTDLLIFSKTQCLCVQISLRFVAFCPGGGSSHAEHKMHESLYWIKACFTP